MYKRISHNILEEHFDELPHMKNNARDSLMQSSNGSLGIGDPLPNYVMNEDTMIFRMDARSAWAKYAWSLLNYGISLNNNLPATNQVEARMLKNAYALGEAIVPYYGVTSGDRVGELLAGIAKLGVEVVEAVKNKKPLDTLQGLWKTSIEELSTLLNKINPNNWPVDLVKDYFTNLTEYWTDQIIARDANDAIADDIAIDKLNKLVVTGITNSSPRHKSSSLADIFSRGIIAQFPSLFADTGNR